ncbi:hypothetical protein [Streptomyces sp. NPDC001404]|uniref:hypothetical protein n=1 Tax=Streptomyces sp. NPDC001404 TaxID=3364571 RepID=UPI003687A500
MNASFRTADTPPDLTSPGGDTYRHLATRESDGGEYGLYKVDLAARAAGARTHFHKAMSESFHVLSRELEHFNGEKWVTGRAGEKRTAPTWPKPRLPHRRCGCMLVVLQWRTGEETTSFLGGQ